MLSLPEALHYFVDVWSDHVVASPDRPPLRKLKQYGSKVRVLKRLPNEDQGSLESPINEMLKHPRSTLAIVDVLVGGQYQRAARIIGASDTTMKFEVGNCQGIAHNVIDSVPICDDWSQRLHTFNAGFVICLLNQKIIVCGRDSRPSEERQREMRCRRLQWSDNTCDVTLNGKKIRLAYGQFPNLR